MQKLFFTWSFLIDPTYSSNHSFTFCLGASTIKYYNQTVLMTIDKGKFNLLKEIFLGLNLIVQSKKVKRYRID
jgi:hypothetical protein